jgi:Rrf2 family nitric oxide-sensitive transcriptional repressor
MHLTQYTDYSLRVLAYLAQAEKSATIAEISTHFLISHNHLVKVVHNLSLNGFVIGTRGKGGGIRLARAPALINIGEVVRVTEPNFDLVECFNTEKSNCALTHKCGLIAPLHEATRAFMAVLDKQTLADIHRETEWTPVKFTVAPPRAGQ